jgi:hypothetical protein
MRIQARSLCQQPSTPQLTYITGAKGLADVLHRLPALPARRHVSDDVSGTGHVQPTHAVRCVSVDGLRRA